MASQGGTRLDDGAVERRLARLDELLAHVERYPGPTADTALEAVRTLTDVYGEALARMVDLAADRAGRFSADELVGHLMVLHDIHPEPVADRVRRALDGLRAHLGTRGDGVELLGIDGAVARVRVSGGGCGCGSAGSPDGTLEQAVRESVLALAPELRDVEPVREPTGGGEPSLIPVESLLSRTAAAGGGP
ncbi:Fe-S cluster biogenesis protein NfuA [Prauserella shujinwangii]|uniref:Fe-S cluster biogenesis protein NfuA n=1 Tax=Prauserella shujinwangii TaxID=1453103 RepID=A0A2T0M2M9_9PSEU|nr:NifU family protein [Prauserella shujinwangii]PRX50994.1 Fe-S cluster biogenesis protein NfuA [Prauserella shujinwangii]